MSDRPRGAPVARGDRLSLEVEAFGDGPDGLARVDGYIVFVAGALPGERVFVEVSSAGRKYGRARLLEVERPAETRVEPQCRHFGSCGSCQLQHLALAAQRAAKTVRLSKALSHALRASNPPVEEMRGPADPWRLRTKVALHFAGPPDRLVAGYFRRRSRELFDVEECPVSDPLALRVALAVRDAAARVGLSGWDPETDSGELRAVVVRGAPSTAGAHATLVVRRIARGAIAPIARAVHDAGGTGLSLDRHDGPPDRLLSGQPPRLEWGEATIEEEIAGVRLRVSPGAFFQTSSEGAAALVDLVREMHGAPVDGRVADLYCGSGLFALAVARDVGKVVGIEESESAIADAHAAAAAAGIENVAFRAGFVERLAGGLARDRRELDAAIVDPPRSGLTRRVISLLLERLTPRRIVYVSCDPDSLARDLHQLTRGGYRLERVVPVDLFPHTHHIEAVAALVRTRPRAGDDARRRLLDKARRGGGPSAKGSGRDPR